MNDDPSLIWLAVAILISGALMVPGPVPDSVPAGEIEIRLITEDGFVSGLMGPYIKPRVLGTIVSLETEEWFKDKDELFAKIVKCESMFRPEVCSFKGCGAGMGLVQFIPSTWNQMIKEAKMPDRCRVPITSVQGFQTDKSHPVFDPECNLEAGWWLYQNEGEGHWGYPGAKWGSWKCWGN